MNLRAAVADALERSWTPYGYAVPHPGRYPHQWLWDSAFHALVWAALGDERAVQELASSLRHQGPSGFVPHVSYDADPELHAAFWGRVGTSSITQPPMYGHAAAELLRRGFDVPEGVVAGAVAGVRFLLHGRRRVGGLVPVLHPWESGADDSPRWDDWFRPLDDPAVRYERKGELVASLEHGSDGAAIGNPSFAVGSAGFNGLVAFNARELAEVTGDERLGADAEELAEALDARWDADRHTWVDSGPSADGSGRIRTLDALLPALVSSRPLPAALWSPAGHGTAFGPSGVHVGEPSYDPGTYWRGSAWPQLTYLLAVAADRGGDAAGAARLRVALSAGATASGLAEHWDAETGAALGAVPQSWTGLAIVEPAPRPATRRAS